MTTVKITNEAYQLKLDMSRTDAPALHSLIAARNDSAAFQLILQSDLQYSVCVGKTDWYSHRARMRGPHERIRVAVTAPFGCELNPEGFMVGDDDLEVADVLLRQDVIEQKANLPVAVWADVKVPADAKAGNYAVTVKVFRCLYGQDEELVFSREIPLTVANYCLPDVKDRKFYLNLWQHLSSIALHHDVPLWSDEHFTVIEEYMRSICALGQKSITLCAGEIPWGGQACDKEREQTGNLFEHSIIGITRKADGTFVYDYEKMQRHIDFCTGIGMIGDIEIFGLVNVWQDQIAKPLCEDYPENIVLRYFDEADGSMKYIREKADILAYIKSLETYFITTGQIDRVRIGADEPADMERYRKTLDLMKEVTPAFQFSTAINHAEFISEFSDRISTATPYLGCVAKEYEILVAHKKAHPEQKLLWYVCGGGGAVNNALRDPLVANRAVGPMTMLFGFDGFLRWNFCLYPLDPRKDIRYSYFCAGDVNFVYPGHNGKPLLSLRYKNLQRGIIDFELLLALREKAPNAADTALDTVFPFRDVRDIWAKGWDKDAEDAICLDWDRYNELKAQLLALLG